LLSGGRERQCDPFFTLGFLFSQHFSAATAAAATAQTVAVMYGPDNKS
jgi:hypothetical protein